MIYYSVEKEALYRWNI